MVLGFLLLVCPAQGILVMPLLGLLVCPTHSSLVPLLAEDHLGGCCGAQEESAERLSQTSNDATSASTPPLLQTQPSGMASTTSSEPYSPDTPTHQHHAWEAGHGHATHTQPVERPYKFVPEEVETHPGQRMERSLLTKIDKLEAILAASQTTVGGGEQRPTVVRPPEVGTALRENDFGKMEEELRRFHADVMRQAFEVVSRAPTQNVLRDFDHARIDDAVATRFVKNDKKLRPRSGGASASDQSRSFSSRTKNACRKMGETFLKLINSLFAPMAKMSDLSLLGILWLPDLMLWHDEGLPYMLGTTKSTEILMYPKTSFLVSAVYTKATLDRYSLNPERGDRLDSSLEDDLSILESIRPLVLMYLWWGVVATDYLVLFHDEVSTVFSILLVFDGIWESIMLLLHGVRVGGLQRRVGRTGKVRSEAEEKEARAFRLFGRNDTSSVVEEDVLERGEDGPSEKERLRKSIPELFGRLKDMSEKFATDGNWIREHRRQERVTARRRERMSHYSYDDPRRYMHDHEDDLDSGDEHDDGDPFDVFNPADAELKQVRLTSDGRGDLSLGRPRAVMCCYALFC